MLLLMTFVEPVFFNFQTSPFLGAMAGLLYVGRNRKTPNYKGRLVGLEAAH